MEKEGIMAPLKQLKTAWAENPQNKIENYLCFIMDLWDRCKCEHVIMYMTQADCGYIVDPIQQFQLNSTVKIKKI